MTKLGLDAEGLTETVLHLNLGFFVFCFFPFDEKMIVSQTLRSLQDRRLKD
jgi:hypothetical protein